MSASNGAEATLSGGRRRGWNLSLVWRLARSASQFPAPGSLQAGALRVDLLAARLGAAVGSQREHRPESQCEQRQDAVLPEGIVTQSARPGNEQTHSDI